MLHYSDTSFCLLKLVKKFCLLFAVLLISVILFSQTVHISVDVKQNRKQVSPYIYGKNNSLSGSPLSEAEWRRLRDAGIKLFRENSGNNATKYNWRLKRTSAPDWYNNVYGANWDYEAQSLLDNILGAKGMFAFQLIGKAALTPAYNFNDWNYNNSQWWPGVNQNLAGGGVVDPSLNSTKALVEGNPDLYLNDWPADSTVAILDKWFGNGVESLHLDSSAFLYWNMDNEPEIWEGTHDDVMPHQLSAEDFMQRYFEVAKKARAKYPGIKLVGFVSSSEWFWYAWPDGKGNSGKISYNGSSYTWIEFFIKRIAEEQQRTGIRLLDVIDLHSYLSASSDAELMQVHRVFYDRAYNYPGANGVKLTSPSGWGNSITKEYIFGRINDWLDQYMGEGHGVTLGSTESGWEKDFNQMPLALNYASTLGVFANEGVELFTPWFWSPSYWEVVHLFSRYCKNISVLSVSDDDNNLSAYSTINTAGDSLTIVLVNRYTTAKTASISLSDFNVTDGAYPIYSLYNLPNDNTTETFVSHTNNALVQSVTVVGNDSLSLTLPAYSITAVVLTTGATATDYLGVTPSVIELDAMADSAFITVSSNVGWTAVSSDSWLSVGPASGMNNGTITISADANPLTVSRSATITVSGTGVDDKTIMVTQTMQHQWATEEMIIYNDNETLIRATWASGGTLSEISSGVWDGTKHYRFAYSYTNWWSGYGLNLTNWSGDGSGYDFTGYVSLKLACSLTGSATVALGLIDADGNTSSNQLTIDGVTGSYKDLTIPLDSFSGMELNDVGEIMININGNSSSGSGTFDIDDIRLGVKNNLNANDGIFTKSVMVYPNPNHGSFIINLHNFDNGAFITVFNLSGDCVYKSGFRIFSNGEIHLPMANSGLYLVRVSDEKTLITRKVTVY